MDIVGDRRFVELAGDRTHKLPPLLVKTVPEVKRLDKIMGMAAEIIEQEDMIPPVAADKVAGEELIERRKMDLALNLIEQYLGLMGHWHWGDAPMRCCSDQFLFYLNNSVAQTAYRTWLNMTPSPISSLPPERFQFEIVNMSLEVH